MDPPPPPGLPLPLLLLTLALASRQAQAEIQDRLAIKPDPSKPDQLLRYAQLWTEYVRQQSDGIGYLSALIENGTGNLAGGQRLLLRARGLIIELEADAGGELASAEQLIAKAVGSSSNPALSGSRLRLTLPPPHPSQLSSSSHPSLFQFHLAFLSHQARISTLSTPPNFKLARNTLKRALSLIASASPPPSSPSSSSSLHGVGGQQPVSAYPEWQYHFLIQLASVATPPPPTQPDFPAALAAWREVATLALSRGDGEMDALAILSVARLSVEQGQADPHLLAEMASLIGFAPEDLVPSTADGRGESDAAKAARVNALAARIERGKQVLPGTLLRVQGALVYCLWCAQEGRVKEAKERLRVVHGWLDERPAKGEEGRRAAEEAGFVQVSLRRGSHSFDAHEADMSCLLRRCGYTLPALQRQSDAMESRVVPAPACPPRRA